VFDFPSEIYLILRAYFQDDDLSLTEYQRKNFLELVLNRFSNELKTKHSSASYDHSCLRIVFYIKKSGNGYLSKEKIKEMLEEKAWIIPHTYAYVSGELNQGKNWKELYNLEVK
jgi:hypothetical protein